VSGQPASKSAPAALRPFPARWHGFAISRLLPAVPEAAAPYWALARAPGGWRVELAGTHSLADAEGFARQLLRLPADAERLEYADRAGGHRFAAFDADGALLGALWIAPEPVAVSRAYAATLLDGPAPTPRAAVLAGRPGAERPDPGALVCSCFAVGANDIRRAVRNGARSVAQVGACLRAGTNCGSCRPEIQGLIDAERVHEPG